MTPAWLTVALSSTTVSAISREKSILFISVDPLSAAGAAQHAGTVGNPARAGAGELEHDTGGRARRQPTPDVHCDEGRARWRGATGRARRVEQRRVTAEIVERSDIGPAMKLPPVLRIVTFCRNRPVAKLKEKPPRAMLTAALISLAQAHALIVNAFEPVDVSAKRGTGEAASAVVTRLKGAKAV